MRWLILTITCVTAGLQAQTDWNAYRQTGQVSDYAQVLASQERKSLEGLLMDLRQQYGVNLGLVTVKSLERYDINEIAKYFYNHWEMGRGSNNQAALMLLSTDDGQVHLYTGMGLRGVLNNKWIEEFSQQLGQKVQERQFDKASVMGMAALVRRVYENASQLPKRNPGALPGNNPLASLTNKVGAMPIASSIAAVFVIILLGAAALQGKKDSMPTETTTGNDFERGRGGPFGTKKQRQL